MVPPSQGRKTVYKHFEWFWISQRESLQCKLTSALHFSKLRTLTTFFRDQRHIPSHISAFSHSSSQQYISVKCFCPLPLFAFLHSGQWCCWFSAAFLNVLLWIQALIFIGLHPSYSTGWLHSQTGDKNLQYSGFYTETGHLSIIVSGSSRIFIYQTSNIFLLRVYFTMWVYRT